MIIANYSAAHTCVASCLIMNEMWGIFDASLFAITTKQIKLWSLYL